MKTIKQLLDETKAIKGIASDYALAKELDVSTQRISEFNKGKAFPNEYACLRIAAALGRPLDEVMASVRIEAEKDEKRREEWRKYYKSIGGFAASFMLIVFALVTFIVTVPVVQAKESTTYDASLPRNTNYAFFRKKIRAAIVAVLHRIASAFPPPCFSG